MAMLVRVDSLFRKGQAGPVDAWDVWKTPLRLGPSRPWDMVDTKTGEQVALGEDADAPFWRAQAEQPGNALAMGVLADWWQERGDARWEAMAYLFERGHVGCPGGYWPKMGWKDGGPDRVDGDWYDASVGRLRPPNRSYVDSVANRYVMMLAYAAATPATRAEWLRDE